MTQDEFYSKLMQDVEYIFKTGFKLSPEIFMQTMSYASEQYELLSKRIAELEAENTRISMHLGIKPKDPVYEYKVRMVYSDGVCEFTDRYFTEEEYREFGFPKKICTLEDTTKRIRQ
jgi:hypothetical protein